MAQNVCKLGLAVAAVLVIVATVSWAQNTCVTTEQQSFICRGSDVYNNCVQDGDVLAPTINTEICIRPAGEQYLCSMTCPLPCMAPDSDCLTSGSKCTAKGRLANPNNCREYYICYATGATFTRYNYTCAGFYDAKAQKCSNSDDVCEERPVTLA